MGEPHPQVVEDPTPAGGKGARIVVRPEDLEALDNLCTPSGAIARNAAVQLQAIQTKLAYVFAKPAQEHELSGNVTIRVECAIPTRASIVAPQHLVSDGAEKTAERVDSPIRGHYVNSPTSSGLANEPEPIADPEGDPLDPDDTRARAMLAPSVIEAGRLKGAPDNRTADQRREDARIEWRADQAKLRGGRP